MDLVISSKQVEILLTLSFARQNTESKSRLNLQWECRVIMLNERLVRRGEFYLSFDLLDKWAEALDPAFP